jgi:NAD(P)-dependent dehydrogenase (short-subunit alcohol dehydrogenase family)
MIATLDRKRFGPWALVTGASSGIGKEFARQIAASGINIVLVARREDLLKEVGFEFSMRHSVEHRVVVLDVSREDFIGQLASATDDLDIGLVVSNAGTGNPGQFLKLDRQLLQENQVSTGRWAGCSPRPWRRPPRSDGRNGRDWRREECAMAPGERSERRFKPAFSCSCRPRR